MSDLLTKEYGTREVKLQFGKFLTEGDLTLFEVFLREGYIDYVLGYIHEKSAKEDEKLLLAGASTSYYSEAKKFIQDFKEERHIKS